MTLYYEDESVTLYCGDSLEILPTLDIEANALLTDPPYFKVKQEEWDNQWDKAHEFLSWMGEWLGHAKPLLTANASVWVFASPAMASSVERLVGERFRVLNSIRWVKPNDRSSQTTLPSLRRFLTQWEGVVFAEQYADAYEDAARLLHAEVFAPLGWYIQGERERAGLSRFELAARLEGYKNPESATANVHNWELGKNLIGEADYQSARKALGSGFLERTHESLRQEFADLRQEFESRREAIEHLRRPFNIRSRAHSTDVWTFPIVPPGPGKHPCEKPLSMLTHMIEASSRPGDLILDPFAGSGSTLDAARQAGRRAIGIEKDPKWCDYIARRLSQDVLNLEGLTA